MAAVLTSQSFPPASAAITYTTSGAGGLATSANTAPTGPGLCLLVKNGSGSGMTCSLTIPAGITLDGITQTTPLVVNIGTGADQMIPLRPQRYADPVTGLATFALSTVTSVSVACVNTN